MHHPWPFIASLWNVAPYVSVFNWHVISNNTTTNYQRQCTTLPCQPHSLCCLPAPSNFCHGNFHPPLSFSGEFPKKKKIFNKFVTTEPRNKMHTHKYYTSHANIQRHANAHLCFCRVKTFIIPAN